MNENVGSADLSSAERRALLAQLMQKQALRPKLAPLSFAQEQLWFLDQLEPGGSFYNMATTARLSGWLDVAILQHSLDEIVRRHQALRTTFAAVEGRPVQVIAPFLNLTLHLIDLRCLPPSQQKIEAKRLMSEEARRPFDLAHGPLVRTTLLWLGAEKHKLLLTMHHIISDAWSMGIFIREAITLYGAFSSGKSSPLPELPLQYADYAAWQRKWLQGEALDEHLSYWTRQLADTPSLDLPADWPRSSAGRDSPGARQTLALSGALTEALKCQSQRKEVTLFMTLLAAFKTLLYRYTGQEDIVIGSPIAGRNRSETEGLIGLFINTLVLRTNLGGNPSFQELLARVRDTCLGAYAHQALPFEKLVAELQPQRDLDRNPLFDVMLNSINSPQITRRVSGVDVSFRGPAEPEPKFPMALYFQEQASELNLWLVYQPALFSAGCIAWMLDQFRYLLEQIVAAPEKPIRSFSLVTPESRPLLPDPSAVLPVPAYAPVTKEFACWAERTPERVAVCQGEHAWTWSKLADCASALVKALLARRLRGGDVVAVLGQRSFGLIASMLAVLSGGGVLLTIDPNLPTQRQQLMLREANVRYLVHFGGWQPEDEWESEFPALVQLAVKPDGGQTVQEEETSLGAIDLPEPAGDDAAYIFFTSGTTGVPKGVLGCHKGLGHFLHWQRETFAIGPGDRCAQLTALSFDVVLRDVFLPLTSGATLCLPEDIDELGLDQVLPWLEREKISVLHAVPTLAQSWLANTGPGVTGAVQWVFFAGEPLTDALVRRWREAFPEAGKIVNLYGPTETTLAKCFYVVPSDVLPGVQPIGRPLSETQALVLSDDGQLCGIGEPGEIVLRTPFQSLGYINAAEEQSRWFVKNPFRDDDRDLLYHTRDRGRYRPDGTLGILGRLDHQVKIRGVRIELDEIAAVLSRHPAVKSCVVVARKDKRGQNFLAAYVVASNRDSATSSELRSYLGKTLPAVMVPSAFVFLERLPLTPTGKVDRLALPATDEASSAKPDYVAPRTFLEKTLAGIWSQVLRVEQVGVYDDFFESGGDSILSIQVVAQASRAGLRLTPRQLFEHRTIAGLAAAIAKSSTLPAEHCPRVGPLPLTPIQHWFFEGDLPVSDHWNSAIMLQAPRGFLTPLLLERAVQHLPRNHDALCQRFIREGAGWRSVIIEPDEPVPCLWVDLSMLPEPKQSPAIEAAAAQMQSSLNLSFGPIMRIAFFDLGPQRPGRLLIIAHHLVTDGFSRQIILEDLQTAYQQIECNEPVRLPKTTFFVQWVRCLAEYARSDGLKQELNIWLAEPRMRVRRLPVDYPENSGNTEESARFFSELLLDPQETQILLHKIPRTCDVQIIEVLLAALAQALTQWTGERILLVDLWNHGRDTLFGNMDLSRTVGWLAYTTPVLLCLEGVSAPGQALQAVKEQLRYIPNQGLGYGLLRYLSGDASVIEKLRALPQPEMNFNYLGQSGQRMPALMKRAAESLEPYAAPMNPRRYLLEFWARIIGGQFGINVRYSENLHRRSTIGRLLQSFIRELQLLVNSC